MAIRLSGAVGRRRRSGVGFVLALAAMAALALPFAGEAAAKAKPLKHAKPAASTAATVSKTTAVPLPRPSPLRAGSKAKAASGTTAPPAANVAATAGPKDDAIAALIAGDDPGEATATEDSDAPEVGTQRRDLSSPPAMPPAKGGRPTNSVGLKLALQLLDNNDPGGATVAAYALPDRVDIKIIDWLIATGGYRGVPSSSLATLRAKLTDWPSQSLMRVRYEQALAREQPSPAAAIKALGSSKPLSDDGTVLLANAYLSLGQKDDAAAVIRPFWRDEDFSDATEKNVASTFADLLRPFDHKARMDRLLYAEDASDALRAAGRLDKNQQAFAKAVALVIKESSKAAKALDALPTAVKSDPLFTYSRIQVLRRSGKIEDAAALFASSPRDPKVLVNPDAWWVERRLVSRALIEQGDAKTAYTLAANHTAESPALRAEAEFHAGWYALEYLHDPARAQQHFANIAAISTMPLSLSRAEYWLGRTAAAAGDTKGAHTHFAAAADYPTTFYGQLAAANLGGTQLGLSNPPAPTAAVQSRFDGRELVQAIRHLTAIGYADRATVFYRALAETLNDPGEVALLAGMADAGGNPQLALQIGKSAASRGLPVETLAFPTSAIPASAAMPNIERPVVFAIARQESAFNPDAVSGAGARGLLQLMPSTAKEIAKSIGVPYSKARLTSDPGYNATLGAAHLGNLVDDFGGSYVMTFAAYNAGASRVAEWVRLHGDPRDPKVDVVNWIEMIPFTETRNYVQRIMENLQVYRARLGAPALTIEADLRRGGPH